MFFSIFLLFLLLLQTSGSTDPIDRYTNLRIYRNSNQTLLAKWNHLDFTTQPIHVSFATTPSFIKGTQLGAFTTKEDQAIIQLPSENYDPSQTVVYIRLTLPPVDSFIESDAWVSTTQCGDGDHYLNDTNWIGELEPDVSKWTCVACPDNARCLGGKTNTWHNVEAFFGTWRHNQANRGASNFSECLAPRMCLGAPNKNLAGLYGVDTDTGIDRALISNSTEGCNAQIGATGPLCSVCVNQTWRTGSFDCINCSERAFSILFMCIAIFLILCVLVATVAVTILDEDTESAIDLQMVKIMVNHLVISSSTSKLPLKWSPWLQLVFNGMDALSFSFGTGAMSLDCIVTYLPWKDTLIMVAFTPIVLVVLPMVILLPCKNMWRTRCRIDSAVTTQVATMIGLLLAHPTVTKVTLHLFACRNINNRKYLEVDFSIDCEDSELLTTLKLALGVPMILLYCIGIPAWYMFRLWRHRLNLDVVKHKYGFLLSGFKPERYYWELYNTGRSFFICLADWPIGRLADWVWKM